MNRAKGQDSPWRFRHAKMASLKARGEGKRVSMESKRFVMNAVRTTKQGQRINIGKDDDEYKAIVGTLNMHADDMKDAGIVSGSNVLVRSEHGEGTFKCVVGKGPLGMIIVPYGPPTCHLMGQTTDGTGMPTSKGWEVEIELIDGDPVEAAPTASDT
jgi:formylmethanofuran dehydrogenase subunit D